MKYEDEKIDFKYNFKIYWDLLKKYKFLIGVIVFTILIGEIFEVFVRYLFKIITDKGAEFVAGNLLRDDFIKILLGITLIYAVSFVIRSISSWFYIYSVNRLDSNSMSDLRKKFFHHILHLHYGFFTSQKIGSMISKLSRGSSSMEKMNDKFVFQFIPLIFSIILVGASIIYFDVLSFVVIFVVMVLFVAYGIIIQTLQNKYSLRANNAEDVEKGAISDIFTNIESVKYFGKENRVNGFYKKLNEITRLSVIKHWDFYNWMTAGQVFIIALGTFFLIYFSMIKFLDGGLTIGTLVFIYISYGSLVDPLWRFVEGIRGVYSSMADFQFLFRYGKITNEIKDKPDAKKLKVKDGSIEFKDVTFGYKKDKLFNNFNLKISKGKKTALVGHSGSGKTTLVKLLYRLYDLENGEILIDGKNINEFQQESLRSEFSIVPQECILFDDTIYNNIAFSNPQAKRDDVIRAMKFAQLYDIVMSFPDKYKTIVGERGIKLSGGEKQRVSIARAILANKRVLVLDEPTSSLDSKTEFEIQKDMEKLMRGRTTLVIAHRLSTIMNSDLIIVLDRGKIVQKGTHNQLIRRKGVYGELWDLQKGGYIK